MQYYETCMWDSTCLPHWQKWHLIIVWLMHRRDHEFSLPHGPLIISRWENRQLSWVSRCPLNSVTIFPWEIHTDVTCRVSGFLKIPVLQTLSFKSKLSWEFSAGKYNIHIFLKWSKHWVTSCVLYQNLLYSTGQSLLPRKEHPSALLCLKVELNCRMRIIND